MSIPTYYIRSVYTGQQSSPSHFANVQSPPIHQNHRYPPGLGLGAWRASPMSNGSYPYGHHQNGSWGVNYGGSGSGGRRVQRPSVRLPYNSRRTPPLSLLTNLPPPPRTVPANAPSTRPSYSSSSKAIAHKPESFSRTRPASQSVTDVIEILRAEAPPDEVTRIHIVSPPDQETEVEDHGKDRFARSKLVAGILLHRVHAVGKPMRRPRSGPHTYVRSGLSNMVSAEC